ncbi:MAG: hypothetical protein ACYSUC_12235 [Planctomycetota bacterium]|jgi:hypothetical protein
MKRNPATYPEALEYFYEVWDVAADWPEFEPIYEALRRGEIPAEVVDPSSLFRRTWGIVAVYEAEVRVPRNHQLYDMIAWFDGDDLEEEYG